MTQTGFNIRFFSVRYLLLNIFNIDIKKDNGMSPAEHNNADNHLDENINSRFNNKENGENLKINRSLFFLPSIYPQCSTRPNSKKPDIKSGFLAILS